MAEGARGVYRKYLHRYECQCQCQWWTTTAVPRHTTPGLEQHTRRNNTRDVLVLATPRARTRTEDHYGADGFGFQSAATWTSRSISARRVRRSSSRSRTSPTKQKEKVSGEIYKLNSKETATKTQQPVVSPWDLFLKRNCWSLLKSKQFESLYRYVLTLREHERHWERVIPASIILKDVAKHADLLLALEYFDVFPQHAHRKLHTMVLRRSLREEGNFETTSRIFKHCSDLYERTGLEALRPDAMMYSEFISGCASAGREEEGFAAFEAYTDREGKEGKEGKGKKKEMNSHVCNAVLELSAPDQHKCTTLFEDFIKGGFVPDVTSLNTIMRSALIAKAYRKCEDVYNYMRMLGIVPNMATFSLLIESYGEQGNYIRAQSVVNQMQSLSLHPSEDVWLSLLEVIGRKRDVNLTQRLWMKILRNLEINQKKPSIGLMQVLMKSFLLQGEGHLVFDIIKQIEEREELELNHTCYTLAIRACRYLSSSGVVTEEEFGKAWEYFEEMKGRSLKPDKDTFRLLISMACEVKDIEKFDYVLKDLSKEYGHKVLDELSRELIKFHLYQDRLNVVWKMYDRSWDQWSHREDSKLFNAILQAAVSSMEFSRAFSIAKDMKSLGHVPAEEQISALESALVECRISGCAVDLDKEFSMETADGTVEEAEGVVAIRSGTAREMRFQVLEVIEKLRRNERSEAHFQVASSLDYQVVRALLENDLQLWNRKDFEIKLEIK